jgi:hypothetical protein
MGSFFSPSAQRQTVTGSKTNKPSGGIVLQRVRFCMSVLYWSARHLSFSRGVWVAHFEGHSWN